MSQTERIRERLIDEGYEELQRPPSPMEFSGHPEADQLVNDVDHYPHAFVLACLADRQIRTERAWSMPFEIRRRLGSFEFDDLAQLAESDWLQLLSGPPSLHRFPERMAEVLHRAVDRIGARYEGYAAHIWLDKPSSATLVRRFLEFHGAGPKIATMAANLLVRYFHVPLRDYRYIDISADTHIRRVMSRLGFVEDGASTEVVVYAAREASPDFPGVFDLVLWTLGREICRPARPRCDECRWIDDCAYASTR